MFVFGNFISALRVASLAKKKSVNVCFNSLVLQSLRLLVENGYISHFVVDGHRVVVFLKYVDNRSVIRNIGLLSTPGKRCYVSKKKLFSRSSFLSQQGLVFVSTPQRGLTSLSWAHLLGHGGELIFFVY